MMRNRMMVALLGVSISLIANSAPAQQADDPGRDKAAEVTKRAAGEAARRAAAEVERKAAAQARMFRISTGFSPSGLEFAAVSDAIRAQVDLPEGTGVVIVHVRPSSPAMKAGFRDNDLLVAVDGESIRSVEQAREVFARGSDKDIKAKIIRAGKEEELVLQIPSEYFKRDLAKRSFTAIPSSGKTEYWIGVSVSPVDPTLRSHLSTLPPDAGLIVNDVAPGSPAEKVGLKKNDVLVSLDGTPLTNPKGVVEQVVKSEGKPIPLDYLRAGKSNTVTVVPEKHDVPAAQALSFEGDRLIFRSPENFFRFEARGGIDPNIAILRDGKMMQGLAARELELRNRFERAHSKELEEMTRRLEGALKEMTAKVEDVRKTVEQLRKAEDDPKKDEQ